jgi:SpoVK/Ycf46/Vps4 family AAA+-type ATPase
VAKEPVRASSRNQFGQFAQLLECPFRWDDLVVGDGLRAMLEDLVLEASERAEVWKRSKARRPSPQGRGLLALFTGPSGTGKTMAAQVVAARLGSDLLRIDRSNVISKYIGETEKNLRKLFDAAERGGAILFFDEADALFGKRTVIKDAHDRFSNIDTGYLLQAIENYRGVVLLASNKKGSIDPALIRRIRYVMEVPKPGARQPRAGMAKGRRRTGLA